MAILDERHGHGLAGPLAPAFEEFAQLADSRLLWSAMGWSRPAFTGIREPTMAVSVIEFAPEVLDQCDPEELRDRLRRLNGP